MKSDFDVKKKSWMEKDLGIQRLELGDEGIVGFGFFVGIFQEDFGHTFVFPVTGALQGIVSVKVGVRASVVVRSSPTSDATDEKVEEGVEDLSSSLDWERAGRDALNFSISSRM